MHAIETLYQEHLVRREPPSRDLLEQHTRGITDEPIARAIAGRLASALAAPRAASRQLFVAGYFSRDSFGGGQDGMMSEEHGLRFRRADCIARWGLETPSYQTVLIHTWRG